MAEGVFRSLTSNLPDESPTTTVITTSKTTRQAALQPTHSFSTIDSAGTGAYHALSSPDARTTAVLRSHGITSYDHRARKVRAQDFRDFDWIFAMDADNLEDLLELRHKVATRQKPRRQTGNGRGKRRLNDALDRDADGGDVQEEDLGKVVLFGSFGGLDDDEEVIDPFYGGNDGFDRAYEQVERFSQGFLRYLKEQEDGRER